MRCVEAFGCGRQWVDLLVPQVSYEQQMKQYERQMDRWRATLAEATEVSAAPWRLQCWACIVDRSGVGQLAECKIMNVLDFAGDWLVDDVEDVR